MILTKLSISKKITGSMSILLFIMLSIMVISFLKIEKTDSKLTGMTNYIIPLSNSIHTMRIYALEQKIIIERLSEQTNITSIKKELNNFKELSQKFYTEIMKSKKLLAISLQEVTLKKDAIKLAQIVPLLKIIKKEHQDFNVLVLKFDKNSYAKDITQEINELDYALLEAVVIFKKLLQAESEDVMIGELKVHEFTLIIALFVFFFGITVSPKISHGIVSPLRKVITAAKAISSGDLTVDIPVTSNDEVGQLSQSFNSMTKELKQKEHIKAMFGKYIDPRIVEGLITDSDSLQIDDGKKKNMTIFFSDIEKFSTTSEMLTPNGLILLMNKYFSLASEPITYHNGVIDKYIGDAIMAFWGAPFTGEENHAKLACYAALEQFTKLDELNENLAEVLGFRKNLPKINIRIGLCTGDVIAGNIGSSNTKSYTVMGDTVNIASRLESANKQFGTRILISESTYKMIEDDFVTRKIDNIIVVGKSEPVSIYELVGEKDKIEKQVITLISLYEQAYSFYIQKDWDNANELLIQCLEINSEDKASQVLMDRISYFKSTPPVSDWDGVWHMSQK